MTANPWVTAGISATVAALTTLVVEFAFKPALEVRKDRRIARSREREALIRRFSQMSIRLHQLKLATGTHRQSELTDQLVSDLRELDGDSRIVGRHLPKQLAELIYEQRASASVGVFVIDLLQHTNVHGGDKPPVLSHDFWKPPMGELIPHDVFKLIVDYMDTAWWRIIRRHRMRKSAEQEAKRIHDEVHVR